MWPSSMFASGFWFEAERLPLVAITADGIKAKDKVHCIHTRVNNDNNSNNDNNNNIFI